jgi:hypothetical protein
MAYIRRCYTSKGEYMNQEDIIRMVREAGWSGIYTQWREPDGSPDWTPVKESLTVPVTMEQIERFAALVAAAEREKSLRLWMLLDDIDTADDIAKSDDKLYRRICQNHQKKRWGILSEAEVDAAIRARSK